MKLNKVISLLLAAAMVFSLAAEPALAADGAALATASSESAADETQAAETTAAETAEKEEASTAGEEAKTSESGSSGSAAESAGETPAADSGSAAAASGVSSTDPADASPSATENNSLFGVSSTDPADGPSGGAAESTGTMQAAEESGEMLEAQSTSTTSAAEEISDVTYPSTQKVTAASFSDYSNSSGMAAGATVTYNRLITYEVTGLTANENSEAVGKANLDQIEKVMRMIQSFNTAGTYPNTVFKVVIPAGTYYIDGTYTSSSNRCLHLYSNTWLSMNGVTLIKRDTKNRASLRTGLSAAKVSGYKGENNIILEGGTWDTNISAYSSSSSHFSNIRLGHGQNIIVANVVFEGAVSGHHLELCGVKNVSVVGCSFLDYKGSGYTKGINRNEALQIDVTNSSNVTPTFEKYDDTITANVVVYNNTFTNVNRGVGSHSAVFGKYYKGIVIESNTFQNVTNQAIFCENYQNCAIKNNTITDCGGGIEFTSLCYAPDGNYYQPVSGMPKYDKMKSYNANTVISGNSISVGTKKNTKLTNASGIYVHGGVYSGAKYKSLKGKKFTLSGVTVTGNTITSCRDTGITLAYANSCKVTKNSISGVVSGSSAKGYGIYLDHCAYGDVSSNTISKNRSHGIYLNSCAGSSKQKLTIKSNKITATGSGGIGLDLISSKYISVGKNSVSAASYAVYLKSCSYCAIGAKGAANTLYTSAKYGVYATKKSKKSIQVYYNKIRAKKSAVKATGGSKIKSKKNTFRKS